MLPFPRNLVWFVFLIALAALAPAAEAATIPVTSEVSGLGGPGECTLAAAIQAANTDTAVNGCPAGSGADIITIPECNLVLTAAFFTDGTDGPIGLPAITSDITIDGFGTSQTFIRRDTGGPAFALFLVSSTGNLKIRDVTLQSGSASYGGAVINRGMLDIQFATLSSNSSTSTTMGGGAVANLGGTLTLNSVQFSSNTTAGLGGAIHNTGMATVSGGFFSGNTASMSGGAIYSGGGDLSVTSATFQLNSAQVFGGAIYMTPGTMLTLTDSLLQFNSAGGSGVAVVGGGAIAVFGPATITNTNFVFNNASDFVGATMIFGGAIYSGSPNLNISRSGFFNNEAQDINVSYGGAILHNGANTDQVTITNTTMGINEAGTGGAFSAMTGVISFNNVTIAQNNAFNGGGVHAFGTATVTFTMRNTIVATNTASVAGPDALLEPGGAITSQGHNLIGIGFTGYTAGTGDLVGSMATPVDPLLIRQSTANRFFTLLTGSPAIDAGDPATPGSGGTACEAVDQRNVSRPVGAACDIGAFEGALATADVGFSMANVSSNLVTVGQNLTFTLELTNFGPQPATNVTMSNFFGSSFSLVSAMSTQGTCTGTTSVSCAIGTMAVNDVVTVTVVLGTLEPVLTPSLTFQSSRTEFDAVSGNNFTFFSGGTIRVARDGDLELLKTAPFQVAVGANASFTLVVRNHSTTAATNVMIADTMPAGFSVVTASLPSGCTEGPTGTVTCTIASLAAGTSTSRAIQGVSNTPGMVTNTASVTATETDPFTTNNMASANTTVRTATDIAVTKTDSPDPLVFAVGAQITYTVTVTNNGPADATTVILSEALDFRTSLVSANITQGACTGTTFLTCNIGTITPMTSVVLTVVVTVNQPCVVRNSASVSMAELDTNGGNNFATAQTTVSGNPVTTTADVSVTKTDSPDPVIAGSPLTYTVTVTNNGPDDAPAVALMDVLPTGVTFESAVSTQGVCSQSSGVVTCNIGTMLDGATVTVTIVVTPNVGGTLTNTADVTSGATDPTPANNTATTTTTVQGPDLTLTPTSVVFPSTNVGASSSMNITLQNTGNATLTITAITITGVNASEFTFPAPSFPLSLAPGAMQALSITFMPTAAGTRAAVLEVASNAVSGAVITAVLNGTGAGFVLMPSPGSPTSTTVVTGGTVTFPIVINSSGAPTTVTLTCTTNAPAATCGVQPASAIVGNNIPVLADVVVGTTSCVRTAPYSGWRTMPPVDLRLLLVYTLLLMMLTAVVWRRVPQARRAHVAMVVLLLWVGLAAGCSGQTEQFGFGTVPGTYNITVTAVSGSTTQTQTFTFTVTLPPG